MIRQTKPRGTALSFSIFHRILWLFLCANALIVYLVSGSIRSAVVTTMVGSLSLQLTYFGGVLLLVWRAAGARRAVQGAEQLHGVDRPGDPGIAGTHGRPDGDPCFDC
ncbi:exopolysaccharide production repressor protein [Ensifer aridi]|uniref:exopolysaccharide production repressor protein n=1 Tax=Ensifer aridi TaxID=1708715 RepID=UPI0022772AB0|nr:exopolysaccharide production repressor protein [Ensifer aridi]